MPSLSRVERLVAFVMRKKWGIFSRIIFSFLFLLPILFLSSISLVKLYRENTDAVISQRAALAFLASNIVHERLSSLVNLSISLATRPRVIKSVAEGDWHGAMTVIADIPQLFPFVDRIVLYDPDAVITADMPVAQPSVIGESRHDKQWYVELKDRWVPIVSGVYIRGADPQVKVVSIVVPIRDDTYPSESRSGGAFHDESVRGILMVQVTLDTFYDWIARVDIGARGLVYIVDQYGKIVYHPKFIARTDVVDFSSVPIIQRLRDGRAGTAVNYNPIEKETRLAAFEPVAEYGWGVVVTQPVSFAFADRRATLWRAAVMYAVIFALAAIICGFVLSFILAQQRMEEEMKKTEDELRALSLIDPLTGLYNRRGFETLAQQQLKILRRNRQAGYLFFIDIDNMKAINDTLGHGEGDQALIDVAAVFRETFREADVVARLGGDEFAVLVLATGKDIVHTLTLRLQKKVAEHSALRTPRMPFYLSIGIAHFDPQHPQPLEVLLERADKMMYEQKVAHKSVPDTRV